MLFVEYSNDNDNNCDDNDWYWGNDDEKDDDWWWGNDDNVTGDDCDEEYTEVSGGSSGGYSSSDRSGSKGTEGNEKKSVTPSNPTTSTSKLPTSKTPDLKQISNINPFLSLPSLPGFGIKSLDNEGMNLERKAPKEDEEYEDDNNGFYPEINLINSNTWNNGGWEENGYNCLKCCQKILDNYKVGYESSGCVFQLCLESKDHKRLEDFNNKGNVQNAKECIARHLKANRPIIVGVNHTLNNVKKKKDGSTYRYNEGNTDHFVVIIGSGHDENGDYFLYVETGKCFEKKSEALDIVSNRLYFDRTKQRWIDKTTIQKNKWYTVTQVRPNDGNNSNTQPQPEVQ